MSYNVNMKDYLATEQQGIELLYRDKDIYDIAFENVNASSSTAFAPASLI